MSRKSVSDIFFQNWNEKKTFVGIDFQRRKRRTSVDVDNGHVKMQGGLSSLIESDLNQGEECTAVVLCVTRTKLGFLAFRGKIDQDESLGATMSRTFFAEAKFVAAAKF